MRKIRHLFLLRALTVLFDILSSKKAAIINVLTVSLTEEKCADAAIATIKIAASGFHIEEFSKLEVLTFD